VLPAVARVRHALGTPWHALRLGWRPALRHDPALHEALR
jgi:hypothetical protein